MIDKKDKKKIEKVLKEFFKKATFEVDFELKEAEDSNLKLELKTDEPQVLIGPQGKTLHALQILLGKMLRKQMERQVYLDVDINQYKQNKIKYLREVAQETADRVALSRKEEALPIMSAYERRIAHMALAERTDITTESAGEDPERRVVVRPA